MLQDMLNNDTAALDTTIGEYAMALYETALSELQDEALAQQVTQRLVAQALVKAQKR